MKYFIYRYRGRPGGYYQQRMQGFRPPFRGNYRPQGNNRNPRGPQENRSHQSGQQQNSQNNASTSSIEKPVGGTPITVPSKFFSFSVLTVGPQRCHLTINLIVLG